MDHHALQSSGQDFDNSTEFLVSEVSTGRLGIPPSGAEGERLPSNFPQRWAGNSATAHPQMTVSPLILRSTGGAQGSSAHGSAR